MLGKQEGAFQLALLITLELLVSLQHEFSIQKCFRQGLLTLFARWETSFFRGKRSATFLWRRWTLCWLLPSLVVWKENIVKVTRVVAGVVAELDITFIIFRRMCARLYLPAVWTMTAVRGLLTHLEWLYADFFHVFVFERQRWRHTHCGNHWVACLLFMSVIWRAITALRLIWSLASLAMFTNVQCVVLKRILRIFDFFSFFP